MNTRAACFTLSLLIAVHSTAFGNTLYGTWAGHQKINPFIMKLSEFPTFYVTFNHDTVIISKKYKIFTLFDSELSINVKYNQISSTEWRMTDMHSKKCYKIIFINNNSIDTDLCGGMLLHRM